MRRSSLKLVLASTLPLALSACSKSDTVEVTAQQTYPSVQSCVDQKVPVDVCSDAYMSALAEHRRVAPTYDDPASCEADFVPGYCQQNTDGKFTPKLGGFQLELTGDVPKSQLDAAKAQAGESGGQAGIGSGVNGFLMGMLVSNMISGFTGGGGRYHSQPVYQERDSRGNYQTSTLSRQIERGKTFGSSTQARNSSSGTYTKSTLGRNSSVSSSVSRGGFGSQATARSGWGGKSSGSGFGG